jgi:hypothetical protein
VPCYKAQGRDTIWPSRKRLNKIDVHLPEMLKRQMEEACLRASSIVVKLSKPKTSYAFRASATEIAKGVVGCPISFDS